MARPLEMINVLLLTSVEPRFSLLLRITRTEIFGDKSFSHL